MERAHLSAQIDSILRENVKAGGLSAAVSSSHTGPYCFQAGLASIAQGEAVDDTHLFGIGSITKVFVAVVVFQLVEEAKLGLTDTVGQHLHADVYRDIDDAETATIEQLLSHRAGIDSWEDDQSWIVDARGAKMDLAHIWEKTETLDYIRRPKVTAPIPGTWYYANTNYTLLGLIVEKITHNTAEEEIRRRILLPLDMKQTFLEGFEDSSRKNVACRYHYATAQFQETAGVCAAFPFLEDNLIEATGSNLSVSWLAGGMISHPLDLIKFALALRDGKLLKASASELMQCWRPTSIINHEMGHGLFRQSLPGEGAWLGHSGGVLGFSAQLWWKEDEDCVVCVLANAGTVHAGSVPFGSSGIIQRSEFLDLALRLVSC